MKKKLLLGGLVVVLACCVVGSLAGYFKLWPALISSNSESVADEISNSVQSAVLLALERDSPIEGGLLLYAGDLDINSYVDDSGESGFENVNGQATVYNGWVEIELERIEVVLGDMQMTARPLIQNGRFTLIDVEVEGGLMSKMLDRDTLATGLEDGINRAFETAGLIPSKAELLPGFLYLEFEEERETTDVSEFRL